MDGWEDPSKAAESLHPAGWVRRQMRTAWDGNLASPSSVRYDPRSFPYRSSQTFDSLHPPGSARRGYDLSRGAVVPDETVSAYMQHGGWGGHGKRRLFRGRPMQSGGFGYRSIEDALRAEGPVSGRELLWTWARPCV